MNPDWTLIEQFRAGDDRAFDELMARYKRPIHSFVFRMIGDAAEAEDVSQDVFVRAWKAFRGREFRPTHAAFSTWLFQVARNAALDCLRRRKRRPTEPLEVLDAKVGVAESGPNARDESMSREIGDRIAAAVARLPEDQRAVLVLSEYEGLSYAEIAGVMTCSVKSVESRLYRARQFLRGQLEGLLR